MLILPVRCGVVYAFISRGTNDGASNYWSLSFLEEVGNCVHLDMLGWPGQEAVQGEAKIPSILFYDAAGKPQAFGAECLTVEMKDRAYEEQWQLAEHFKLHLHPETMKSSNKIQRTELPRGVGILQVYADWMKYLFQETKKGFIKRIVNGEETWKKVENSIEFVFGIPNGWDIVQ